MVIEVDVNIVDRHAKQFKETRISFSLSLCAPHRPASVLEAPSSRVCRGALVPIFEAPLLQQVGAIFQDIPGRHFRLNRSWEFLPFKAVKEMQSGQESVVSFISVLAHNDPYSIPLQFYNICVGHSSILANKALLNPHIV